MPTDGTSAPRDGNPSNPLRPSRDEASRAWAERVHVTAAQSKRLSEVDLGRDPFAVRAEQFRDDPRRAGDAALDVILSLARPTDTWIDIGAGGGRYALPLALRVEKVIALDPSVPMLDVLSSSAAEHGIERIQTVQDRWPSDAAYAADVALICNVGYGTAEIGTFIDQMERTASRLCVALMRWAHPTSALDWLWPVVYGEERHTMPALRELLALLLARETIFDVRMSPITPQSYATREAALTQARHHLRTTPGSAADERLRSALETRLLERNGRWMLSGESEWVGVVSWSPEA